MTKDREICAFPTMTEQGPDGGADNAIEASRWADSHVDPSLMTKCGTRQECFDVACQFLDEPAAIARRIAMRRARVGELE